MHEGVKLAMALDRDSRAVVFTLFSPFKYALHAQHTMPRTKTSSTMQQDSPLSLTHSNTASPSANEHDGHNDKKITRRSHRKSRAGCKNCKNRRIKVG